MKSDKLIQIVKSLSSIEKGEFKKHVRKLSGNSEKQYISLFENIDKHGVYSADGASVKNYLYNTLLDFLENFSVVDPIEDSINKSVKRAQLLYGRGIYNSCNDLVMDACQKAEKYECYPQLLQLYDIKLLLIARKNDKNLGEKVEDVMNDKATVIKKIDIQTHYHRLFILVNNFYAQYQALKEHTELLVIDEWKNTPLMQDEKHAITFYSKFYYHAFHQLYAAILKKDTFQIKQDIFHLWEAHPYMKEKNPSLYFNVLSTCMLAFYQRNMFDRYTGLLKKAETIKPLTENDRINFTYRIYKHHYDLLMVKHDYKRLPEIGEKARKQLEPVYISPIHYSRIYIGMEFSLAVGCFLAAEYKKSQNHVNLLLNTVTANQESWQYMYYSARLLQLLIFYEMEDYTYLNDLIVSTNKYFRRHHVLKPVHLLLMNHLKNTMLAFGKNERVEKFKAFKDELEKLSTPSDLHAIFQFDIYIWVGRYV